VTDDLPDDPRFQIAYREVARSAELARPRPPVGPRLRGGVGGEAGVIERKVRRRLGPVIRDSSLITTMIRPFGTKGRDSRARVRWCSVSSLEIPAELVKMAVGDVPEGRGP
jgi:hypothetical protein